MAQNSCRGARPAASAVLHEIEDGGHVGCEMQAPPWLRRFTDHQTLAGTARPTFLWKNRQHGLTLLTARISNFARKYFNSSFARDRCSNR
jgi:hypothetical protein